MLEIRCILPILSRLVSDMRMCRCPRCYILLLLLLLLSCMHILIVCMHHTHPTHQLIYSARFLKLFINFHWVVILKIRYTIIGCFKILITFFRHSRLTLHRSLSSLPISVLHLSNKFSCVARVVHMYIHIHESKVFIKILLQKIFINILCVV